MSSFKFWELGIDLILGSLESYSIKIRHYNNSFLLEVNLIKSKRNGQNLVMRTNFKMLVYWNSPERCSLDQAFRKTVGSVVTC